MTPITFIVYGTAEPKGSTKAFVRKMGGTYRAIVTSDNPDLKKWEQLIRFEASTAARRQRDAGAPPVFFEGAVVVSVRFGLLRPPSVSAKKRPFPIVKPDVDKLLRASIDPLIGVLFHDDAQVVAVSARKLYLDEGPAFAEITVSQYEPLTIRSPQ